MSKMNKRLVRERLANWESRNNPLTALSTKQKDTCIQISSIVNERRIPTDVRRVNTVSLVCQEAIYVVILFNDFLRLDILNSLYFIHLTSIDCSQKNTQYMWANFDKDSKYTLVLKSMSIFSFHYICY